MNSFRESGQMQHRVSLVFGKHPFNGVKGAEVRIHKNTIQWNRKDGALGLRGRKRLGEKLVIEQE